MGTECQKPQAKKLLPKADGAPLGQSAGGHNDPLPELGQQEQQEGDNDSKFKKVADNNNLEADNNSNDAPAPSSSDNSNSTESSDEDNMAAAAGAAAGDSGDGRTKPIIPTFSGESDNIYAISTNAKKFIDSFLASSVTANMLTAIPNSQKMLCYVNEDSYFWFWYLLKGNSIAHLWEKNFQIPYRVFQDNVQKHFFDN